MKWLIVLSTLLASSVACARDYFDFDRNEALRRIRAAVEKQEAILPIPTPECKPNPAILRHCQSKIHSGLELLFSDTIGKEPDAITAEDLRSFKSGENIGKVYQMFGVLTASQASEAAFEGFDTLCVSIILAGRPNHSIVSAKKLYSRMLRQATNRSADDGLGKVQNHDRSSTLEILISRGALTGRLHSIECHLTSEDDLRR